MRELLECYNSFKGESEQTYIDNYKWYNEFASTCKTQHPMDTKIMLGTIFSIGWKLILTLSDKI